jgi:hypothetical protein
LRTKTKLARLKTTVNKALLTALTILVSLTCQGQEWDFSTWHKVVVKGELTKKISLSLEQQLRLQDNSSAIDETFTEIGLGYDLPKGFALSGAYRLGWSPDNDGFYSNRHRYNIDLKYGRKIWKLQAKVRARFQHRPAKYLLNDRLEPNDSPAFARIKLSVNYRKLKKWTPGLEFETFIRLDSPIENRISRFRYRVFLDYDLPKRQELGLFYMIQTDFSGNAPEFVSSVGISYSYEWKRPKKKKKKKNKKKKDDK